ncbi:MAG: amino acid transporter [Bacteroidetes bacterium GWE2_29_8]|nr:MAG: amino acid transporter [Bacteroidetes bacterium GWE2_29_8]OFY25226.1 MAG: amino acid transporter [Bacteroidetes bacterium GWF2_29_10]
MSQSNFSLSHLKKIIFGKARDITDASTFSKISLVAFFAWVGLGADPLSSSCYGPEEIYRNLSGHTNLSLIVGLITIITIFVISTSYIQIIKLFPNGGGGYLVASRLISPTVGMISGSALLIDYILTITLSISSGADAIFSFLPESYHAFKLSFAIMGLFLLVILNLRGVRESVMTLTPIFIIFVATHIFLIVYVIFNHLPQTAHVVQSTSNEFNNSVSQLGILGTIALIFRAYSLGAGTYTGIEAVSNGIPNLREPKVKTALKTMRYLSISLAIAVLGLMISYYLLDVKFITGKTLNAVLVDKATFNWNPFIAKIFTFTILISEAAILFVAAQTGFLDGPRIMSNMADDNWLPRRFMSLSDRLVSQNGILIMGFAALIILIISKGNVSILVILYSINVFITFSLSQLGMVRHWYYARKNEKKWFRKLLINGVGLILTLFILFTVTIIKFSEGGWLTLLITGIVVTFAIIIKIHYNNIARKIINTQRKLNPKMNEIISILKVNKSKDIDYPAYDKNNPTAVILVNGYSGIGLYSFFYFISSFHGIYKNIIFLQIGLVNTHSSKSIDDVEKMNETILGDLNKYVYLAKLLGFNAEHRSAIGTNIVEEIEKITPSILLQYPNTIFIGGQLIFKGIYRLTKILHNYTIFEIQRKLYQMGVTTIVIPVSLDEIDPLLNKIKASDGDNIKIKYFEQT